MIKPPFDKFLMFDVESVGLHGQAFSVGYVVCKNGEFQSYAVWSCEPSADGAHPDDIEWVLDNVQVFYNAERYYNVKNAFWQALTHFQSEGYAIISDCAWPVEGRFLNDIIDDNMFDRRFKGPYPLYDLSSVLAALGYDPIGTYPRKENELPAHNPLCDARQSARVLLEAMAGTLEVAE